MPDKNYKLVALDSYFDKILYINLKKDVHRNEEVIRQFEKFEITNYERIEAIELTEFPALEYYRNFIKNDHKYILGQLSCRASHIKCMKIAKERNYSKVLILEDDILCKMNPNLLLTLNAQNLNDWDMLYFGGLIEPHFRNQIVCTHAYAVKDSMFENIINMAEPSGMEIDLFYSNILQHMSYIPNRSGKYNIQLIQPFNQIVQNKSFASNIQS